MTTTLILHNAAGHTLGQYRLTPDAPLYIPATPHLHYRLADANGRIPADMQSGRNADDLIIHINGKPQLIIEDYFFHHSGADINPQFGTDGSGHYPPHTTSAPSHLLADHIPATSNAIQADDSAPADEAIQLKNCVN